MPGYDSVDCVVTSVNGENYTISFSYMDKDIEAKYHANTGYSIGDSGLL